jgi:hypothetical protein
MGTRRNDVTFVEASFLVAVCVISVLWVLVDVPWNIRQDRMNEVGGLDNLDELRWTVWTPSAGWVPVTCWYGCSDLHRDDWWRAHLGKTCWHGCEDLHRDDWWMAYLDQAEGCRQQTLQTRNLDLRHQIAAGLG